MRTARRLLNALILVLSVFVLLGNKTYAFIYNSSTINTSILINLGEGNWEEPEIPSDILNLNEMTEAELKEPIPHDTIFKYNGLLYISNPNANYVPYWNGYPDNPNIRWAIFSLELEWIPNTNYRNNSVVTRFGKFYITNNAFNTDWFVDDPATNRNEWLEINAVSISSFPYFNGTTIRDFRKNYSEVVFK